MRSGAVIDAVVAVHSRRWPRWRKRRVCARTRRSRKTAVAKRRRAAAGHAGAGASAQTDRRQQNSAELATRSAMVGAWEFSNADHDKICRFNFRADAVPGGYRLDIDKNCPNLFPSTKDIVAWTVDNYGELRLLDAQGNAVIELTEVESGMYRRLHPRRGPLHLADRGRGADALGRRHGRRLGRRARHRQADLHADAAPTARPAPTSWR